MADIEWAEDQRVLTEVRVEGERIALHNVRNFSYESDSNFAAGYIDRTILLSDVKTVDLLVSPLSSRIDVSHSFLSFGLADGTHLAISSEARRKKGERYGYLKGLFSHYPLIYIIATEADAITQRIQSRGQEVFLYPIRAQASDVQQIFLAMIKRAEDLRLRREPYFLFTNSCTLNLVRHVNALIPQRIPWSLNLVFSRSVAEVAYKLGLVDTQLSFGEAKVHFRITEKARAAAGLKDFSQKIRA